MEKKITKESSQGDEKLESSEAIENLKEQIAFEDTGKESHKNEESKVKKSDQATEQNNEKSESDSGIEEISNEHEDFSEVSSTDRSKINQNEEFNTSENKIDKETINETSEEVKDKIVEQTEKPKIEIETDIPDKNAIKNVEEDLSNTENEEKVDADLSDESQIIESKEELVSVKKVEDKKTEQSESAEQHLDYSNYSKKQMVQVLESLQKENNFSQISKVLKEIKKAHDPIIHGERKSAFDKYVLDGGEKEGFEYRLDDLDQQFQNLFNKLKERKNQYFNSLEKQKESNLSIKLEIIEKLRAQVDSEETGSSIHIIKELQRKWKEVGQIPFSQTKSLWANFNALLDLYYDQRSIYYELKELDRKKNFKLKIDLCEKAENLSGDENIRDAIKKLNDLHEEFKHIGPVPKDDQEVIWERFKAASDKIYLKRKAFYGKLKEEHNINEIAKEALIEKLSHFTDFSSEKISEWNSKTKELLSIQKEWEAIGSMSKEKAKSINRQFWVSFKSFFNMKGQFFKKIDSERNENLLLKQQLVEKAEELKESEDFRKTTEELKQLQKQWKEIGPVSEKHRNEVYFKFKKACDYFFDRRRENSGATEKDYNDNLKKKQLLCDEIEEMSNSKKVDINRIKLIEVEWSEIGFVPKASIKSIQERYLKLINEVTENANIPESEKHKLRFSAQFNKSSSGPGTEKLILKKEGAIRRQVSTLESDINLWTNNLDFFASSKNADKLKEEYQLKIDKAITKLKSLKDQLKVISNI